MSEETRSYIPFSAMGSYPARAGNMVRPLIDGEPSFRRICEAVEAARHSIWVTIAFIRPDFLLPDGRGTVFDLLDRAQARGLDVRVIFWRPNPEATYVGEGSTFAGSSSDREMLHARGSRLGIRWDRAHGAYCQHQKSWLIDAAQASQTAFVGGININPRAMVSPGHPGGAGIHDAYVEVAGPAATDVHHNFVQRWNEASERTTDDGVWGHAGEDTLAFPDCVSAARGDDIVQIQRNIRAGIYRNGHPSPGADGFDIANGESAIRTQYLAAIGAARRSIYIENQALSVEVIVASLRDAVARGVETVVLLPADPGSWMGGARRKPEHNGLFDRLALLGRHENFTLAGIAAPDAAGIRTNIYVHAKLMLVDDVWATIGSCNLHRNSLFGHSEMNASFWGAETVRALRGRLFAEHLARDTAHLDDRAALQMYRQVAKSNRALRDAGRSDWQGLAFSLDPACYGMQARPAPKP